jgi:hypothetical protein
MSELSPGWNEYVTKGDVYVDPYPGAPSSISASTQPSQSSFDWLKGIEAIGGLAQNIGKGIYLAKGYQPGPYMGSSGFGTEAERGQDDSYIKDVMQYLLELSKEKRDKEVELTPLRGSQSVV